MRSFIPMPAESHFPIQNLPYGVFRRGGGGPRLGVAIGDQVLDLLVLDEAGLLPRFGPAVFRSATLNLFMSLGRDVWRETRETIRRLLREDEPVLRDNAALREHALVPQREVTLLLPAEIGDYTDFYSS